MFVIELLTPKDRRAYASEVWELIVKTYEAYGNSEDGNLYGADLENLIETPGVWKLAFKGERMVAGVIFRKHKGNKMRLVLHNNTREGKDVLKALFLQDFEAGRCWGEVSGHLERILRERGLKPISNVRAAEILNQTISSFDPNGENYERIVHYDPKTEVKHLKRQVLFGTVEKEEALAV
jgi:hypothetical protein